MTNMKATKRAILSSVLATVLCFAMLAGTTFAWFTDTVTSSGNIIQTGSLEVGMYWADGSKDPAADDTTWTDASEGPMYTADTLWEPGYADAKHIKIVNEGNLALNYKLRIVADGIVGKLADVIDVYYFEVAEKQTDRATNLANAVKLGTLTEVLGTSKNLSKYVNGMLVPEGKEDATKNHYSEKTISLVLVLNTEAGNEYNNTSLGCEFSVELVATQASYESDSYDEKYDENVSDPSKPSALVTLLDDLKVKYTTSFPNGAPIIEGELETGYKFEPTMGRPSENGLIDLTDHLPYDPEYSVENSEYRWWHADFVVYADKTVPANSIGLAGYYSAFCDTANNGNWVVLSNDGFDVVPTDRIRLVKSMSDMMGNMTITVSWNDLCLYGNDGKGFMCGLDAIDAEALAGTTVTVELRMYPTECDNPGCHHSGYDCETGESITIGTFTYTFTKEVSDNAELVDALNSGVGGITLTEGEYTLPTNLENVYIDTKGDVVVNVASDNTVAVGDNVSLKGITFSNNSENENGVVKATGENITIEGCTFELADGSVGVAVNGNGTSVTIKDCVFSGGFKHVGPVAGSSYNVTIDNCTFADESSVYGMHLNAVGGDIIVKNSTIGLFNTFFGQENVSLNTGKLYFENCDFVCVEGKTNVVKLYRDAEFVDCDFEDGFLFSGGTKNQVSTWTFTNCTYGDGPIKNHILNDSFSCIITANFDGEVHIWDKTVWTKQ